MERQTAIKSGEQIQLFDAVVVLTTSRDLAAARGGDLGRHSRDGNEGGDRE